MTNRHLTLVTPAGEPARDVPRSTARDERPVIVHVAGSCDDASRFAGVAWALAETGAFEQEVLDATRDPATADAIAALDVPAHVRRVDIAAASEAQRLGGLRESIRAALSGRGAHAVMVYADDDAALAATVGAAHCAVPVVRVGAAAGEGSGRLICHLADLVLVHDEADVEAVTHGGIPSERVRVVGNPLVDAVRRSVSGAGPRHPWRRAGVEPGRFVLAVLDGRSAPWRLAQRLVELATSVPVVVELSPAVADGWRANGMFAALEASTARVLQSDGLVERLALAAAAGAIVTDSRTLSEAAALVGISCHGTAEDGWAIAPRPRRRVVAMWDRRAGTRVADVMVANFARVRLG